MLRWVLLLQGRKVQRPSTCINFIDWCCCWIMLLLMLLMLLLLLLLLLVLLCCAPCCCIQLLMWGFNSIGWRQKCFGCHYTWLLVRQVHTLSQSPVRLNGWPEALGLHENNKVGGASLAHIYSDSTPDTYMYICTALLLFNIVLHAAVIKWVRFFLNAMFVCRISYILYCCTWPGTCTDEMCFRTNGIQNKHKQTKLERELRTRVPLHNTSKYYILLFLLRVVGELLH